MAAPALGTRPFTNVTNCALHIRPGATGYGVNPWTNIIYFSSIVTDL